MTAIIQKIGIPRLIISTVFLIVLIGAGFLGLPVDDLLSSTLIRVGIFGVLVIAMVPSIQAGTGPNFALPIGMLMGLLGGLISLEMGLTGWLSFFAALAIGIVLAGIVGYFYGILLNKVKGAEMTIATYTGFAVVSLMCIAWILLPFSNPALIWPLGKGLKNTIPLDSTFGSLFMREGWQVFTIFGVEVPWFMLAIICLIAFAVWVFTKSKTGTQILAVGKNPQYAKSNGIDIDKSRIIASTLSMVLGAVGILFYSQGFGFLQLYTAPLMMAFPAVAAILIGGATASRAKVGQALIGTLLFQGLLVAALPVANELFPKSDLSEILRMVVQNGIILYALTKVNTGGHK